MATKLADVSIRPIVHPKYGKGFEASCNLCGPVAWTRTRPGSDLEAIRHRASHQTQRSPR